MRLWLALAAALGLALVFLGNVFPDEGWYLYAGRRIADGALPYRDFAHFQAPLAPYLFALADGDRTTGRLLSLACGLTALALVLDLARARGGARALTATALLVVPATYTWRWFAVCRNIAPAALFLALGVWLCERRERPAAAALAMSVAAAFRLSALGGLVALVLFLLGRGRFREARRALLSGALALTILLSPFALAAPGSFLFDTVLYHTGLHTRSSPAGEVRSKVQGLLRLAEHHHLLALALVLAIARARARPRTDLALATAAAVTALHLVPGRLHTEYHELAVPLLALVAGTHAAPHLDPKRLAATPLLARIAVLALAALQLAGARAHLYTATGWSPALIDHAGTALARTAPEGEPVLTFVPDFALAADLPLWPGLEMGSVSLARPELSDDACARLHVVTLATLTRDISHRGPGAIVWRDLEDADPRRTALYDAPARAALDAALHAAYEPAAQSGGWTILVRRAR